MVQNTSHSPPFSLPLRYMLTGLTGFILFAVDLVVQHAHVAAGVPYVPVTAALTHLLTLGVLMSFVMGAVYQLLTVAFLTPIRGRKVAALNYWAFVVGVIGLWWSMANWSVAALFWFGSLVSVSLWVYVGIVLASVQQSEVRGAMRGFVQAAHCYLALAVVMAWLMVFSFWSGSLSKVFLQLLATHILLAVGGFFVFLIIGFSYKLFPMFTLSHGFSTRRQNYTLVLFHLTLWLFVGYIWAGLRGFSFIAAATGIAGSILELMDLRDMYKKRMRKNVDRPIRFVFVALALAAVGLVMFFVSSFQHPTTVVWQDLVSLYLLGVVALTVMSYAYKIVPFLVWTYRYGKNVGKGKVPMMADLLNLKRSVLMYIPYLLGLTSLLVGVEVQVAIISLVGCILLGAGTVIFALQMMYVLDFRKLPKELWQRDGKAAL